MSKIIDSSWGNAGITVGALFGIVSVRVKSGHQITSYSNEHIVNVRDIDSDVYRSAGGAATGAIVGGLLTGGVGLLAGAAYGGRRKKKGAYLIEFMDGNYIAFETASKGEVRAMDGLLQKQKVSEIRRSSPIQLEYTAPLLIEDMEKEDGQIREIKAPIRSQAAPPKIKTASRLGENFMVGVGVVALISAVVFFMSNVESAIAFFFFFSPCLVSFLFLFCCRSRCMLNGLQ